MRKFFLIQGAVLLSLLASCGGGGGGGGANDPGSVTPAAKTISYFDTNSVSTISPELMSVTGSGYLAVAVRGSNRVDVFNLTDGGREASYSAAGPVGVSVRSGNDVYYTSGGNIYTNGGTSSVVSPVGGNYTGLLFASSSIFYVANIANGGSIDKYTLGTPSPTLTIQSLSGFPSALAKNGNDMYVTMTDGHIAQINLGTDTLDQTNNAQGHVAWGTFEHPSGIVIDNGYAYVANNGPTNNGDGGYIVRVKIADQSREVFVSDSVGIWETSATGFCGPSGLAVSSGYLYVSNGTCTSSYSGYGNRNRLLKIKLP